MTLLSVSSCKVDVGNESGQAFATGFFPVGESACQVIYRLYNVRPADAC